nr:ABC transporter permease [Nitrospinota bacterium]
MVRSFFGFIGRGGFNLVDASADFFREISGLYYLTRATLYCTFIEPLRGKPNKWRPVWTQMEEVGVKSTTIVFLVSFLIGVILAFQSAHQLSRLGALEFVGALVGVAILRELGPLMTALVMAGRVGAAFTAEMGTMKRSDESLGLGNKGLEPVKVFITPPFLALLFLLPRLSIMAEPIGKRSEEHTTGPPAPSK